MNKAKTFTREQRLRHKTTVGRIGSVKMDEMDVSVRVVAERFRYGRLDLQVKPIAGSGFKWVEFHNVRILRRGD